MYCIISIEEKLAGCQWGNVQDIKRITLNSVPPTLVNVYAVSTEIRFWKEYLD